jgi:hypothetical protein
MCAAAAGIEAATPQGADRLPLLGKRATLGAPFAHAAARLEPRSSAESPLPPKQPKKAG